MNILLAGGTGFLGSNLTRALESAGHSVYFLSRKKITSEFYYQWNPSRNEIDPDALADKDIIINLSGAGIGNRLWTRKYKKIIRTSRLQSTKLLVESVLKLEKLPELFISGSAIGYYGSRPGIKLSENAGPGSDFLASLCVAWEKELDPLREKKIPVAVLRTGIVLGKGGGSLPKLQLPLKFGLIVSFGSGKQNISWIHIADFIRIVEYLIKRMLPQGTYNLVGPKPVSQLALNKAILKSTGGRAFSIKIPEKLIKFFLGEMSALFLSNQYVVPDTLLRSKYNFLFKDINIALENINSNTN